MAEFLPLEQIKPKDNSLKIIDTLIKELTVLKVAASPPNQNTLWFLVTTNAVDFSSFKTAALLLLLLVSQLIHVYFIKNMWV